MCADNSYRYKKLNYIQSCKAEPIPPLGTVLGNLGVNTVSFCNNFNLFTAELPIYFLLKVIIYIYDNKSVSFKVFLPSTSFILNLLKFEIKSLDSTEDDEEKEQEKRIFFIKLFSIVKVAKFKFPSLELTTSIPIV